MWAQSHLSLGETCQIFTVSYRTLSSTLSQHKPASFAKGPSQHWFSCLSWLNGKVSRLPQQCSTGTPPVAWHSCSRWNPPRKHYTKCDLEFGLLPRFEWKLSFHWSSYFANSSDNRLSHSQILRRHEPGLFLHTISFLSLSVSWIRLNR